MVSSNVPKPQWDAFATQYSSLEELPSKSSRPGSFAIPWSDIRGQKFLDLGCGTGLHARIVFSMGAARLVGLDIARTW